MVLMKLIIIIMMNVRCNTNNTTGFRLLADTSGFTNIAIDELSPNFSVNIQGGSAPIGSFALYKQSNANDRYTIATTSQVGSFPYVWIRTSGTGSSTSFSAEIKQSLSFSASTAITALPSNNGPAGYVSYDHPECTVRYGYGITPSGDFYQVVLTCPGSGDYYTLDNPVCSIAGSGYAALIGEQTGSGTPATVTSFNLVRGNQLRDYLSPSPGVTLEVLDDLIAIKQLGNRNDSFPLTERKGVFFVYTSAEFVEE